MRLFDQPVHGILQSPRGVTVILIAFVSTGLVVRLVYLACGCGCFTNYCRHGHFAASYRKRVAAQAPTVGARHRPLSAFPPSGEEGEVRSCVSCDSVELSIAHPTNFKGGQQVEGLAGDDAAKQQAPAGAPPHSGLACRAKRAAEGGWRQGWLRWHKVEGLPPREVSAGAQRTAARFGERGGEKRKPIG